MCSFKCVYQSKRKSHDLFREQKGSSADLHDHYKGSLIYCLRKIFWKTKILTPTYVCVSGGKKCLFFGKFYVSTKWISHNIICKIYQTSILFVSAMHIWTLWLYRPKAKQTSRGTEPFSMRRYGSKNSIICITNLKTQGIWEISRCFFQLAAW